jgi:hypothetical protein
VRVKALAWGAIFSRAAVVAAGVFLVALPVVGVGNELGVAAVGAALAAARVSAETVVVAASVGPMWAAIEPLDILVVRVDCGILVGC